MEFLDHLESRLHSMRGWAGKFVYRGSWTHCLSQRCESPLSGQFGPPFDVVALRSLEFFLPISDLQQTHFSPWLFSKLVGLFFQAPAWFCAISGQALGFSEFELMTSFPFPDENSVVIANLRDLTSALGGGREVSRTHK